MTAGGSPAAVVEELTRGSRADLLARFAALGGPRLALPEGAYVGHLPVDVDPVWRAWAASTGSQLWIGKAFATNAPGSSSGTGHNLYAAAEPGEPEHTGLPFTTSVIDSALDGRPSVLLDYRSYPSWAGKQGLVDEVRPVADGVLLGVYRTDRPIAGFAPRLAPDGRADWEVFVLSPRP